MSVIMDFCFHDENQNKEIEKIGKALSSPVRISIIRQLYTKPMTISELSALNDLPNSTIIFHLQILTEANIVIMHLKPNKKGHTQVFFLNVLSINFSLINTSLNSVDVHEQSMPVGMYTDAEFYEYVRFATTTDFIRIDTNDCFNPLRAQAQLLWTNGGRITYSFGNHFTAIKPIQELLFSLEICSECTYYNNDWKSDITFAVNNIELLTYTSPGDYGGIRGKLNPEWWMDNSTQYGDLIHISINDNGVFLNNNLITNALTLSDLKINENNRILFSIYTKKDAIHYGGFNIFGKEFGNHPQDILLTAIYKKD